MKCAGTLFFTGVMVLLCRCELGYGDQIYSFPDAEMMHFLEAGWGSSSVSATDVPGDGVKFTLGLVDKTGTKDDWSIHSDAGLAYDSVLNHANSSIAAWDMIQMKVTVLSGPTSSDLDIHLFMNTGLTGPSGDPSNDLTNDTFWGGNWINVGVGESATLTLDFSSAEAWNITDNKIPHTGGGLNWPAGAQYAINNRDLHEVSSLGFEFADFDGNIGAGQVEILLEPIPKPGPLPGDANNDGVVSADDYGEVQLRFGDVGEAGILGDANLDGVVSADDYGSVQLNFGTVYGMGGVPVPEPATIGLLLLGGALVASRRRPGRD